MRFRFKVNDKAMCAFGDCLPFFKRENNIQAVKLQFSNIILATVLTKMARHQNSIVLRIFHGVPRQFQHKPSVSTVALFSPLQLCRTAYVAG